LNGSAVTLLFGGDYDRIRLLRDAGQAVGLDIDPAVLAGPKAAFEALARSEQADGGEMSVSFYMTQRSKQGPDCDFVALPVWISRSFRHGNVYVREDSGLRALADLAGRKVGLAEYGMTMAVWLRGILYDEAGVKPAEVTWCVGRDPAALGDGTLRYPADVTIVEADRAVPLLDQVASGGLDAVIGAGPAPPPPCLRRLLRDYVAEERAYYRRTGVFPIMHVLVLRRRFVRDRPDDVRRIFDALVAAKLTAQRQLWSTSVSYATLPWPLAAVEDSSRLMGPDPWPYGIAQNLPTLRTLHRYMDQQGLLWATTRLDEFFVPFEPDSSPSAWTS
jgi:4,5-dihydroxyphthalate decarboxylase